MNFKIVSIFIMLLPLHRLPFALEVIGGGTTRGVVWVKSKKLVSGKYGDISVAVNGDTVTGVYEYYDKWNNRAKEFTDINVFYFIGILDDGEIKITTGWPGSELIPGTIKFQDGFNLTLEDQPNGYAAVDFTEKGYQVTSCEEKNWTEIGIIKTKRSYLYKSPSLEKTKTYVVEGDVIKVIEKRPGWLHVEFNSQGYPEKSYTGWIHSVDLYNKDPTKW